MNEMVKFLNRKNFFKLQAIKFLYNSEFMPYIVYIAPPPYEEFKQLYQIHPSRTKPKSVRYKILQKRLLSKTQRKIKILILFVD